MLHDKKISHLYKELPDWIEHWTQELNRILIKGDPVLVAIAYFDLAHGKLANNEITEAKTLFYEGTKALMIDHEIKPEVTFKDYFFEREYAIKAYIGGNKEFARPFAKRLILEFNTRMARVPKPYLSPAERIYEDFYLLLDELILDNINEIYVLIESLDKRLSKFKIKDSLYKPSGLYHKYPLFGKEMVKALLTKDERKFSENLFHWTQLKLNAISFHDTPASLADIKLILLYDLAIGNGMRPKLETPLIPKSVIENGYWNKRS